jgi:hypothetical protein
MLRHLLIVARAKSDKSAPPRTEEIVPLPPTLSAVPFSPHLHPSRDAPSRASQHRRPYARNVVRRAQRKSLALVVVRVPSPPKGGGEPRTAMCHRQHCWHRLVISPTMVVMLIRPTLSHLATVDANINIVAVVAVTAMTLNATTGGGTIRGGLCIRRHCSIRLRGGEEG